MRLSMTELVPFAISITEAVRVVGLSRTSIYAAIAAGKLIPRKSGRRTLLETEELRRFIASLPKSESSNNAT